MFKIKFKVHFRITIESCVDVSFNIYLNYLTLKEHDKDFLKYSLRFSDSIKDVSHIFPHYLFKL